MLGEAAGVGDAEGPPEGEADAAGEGEAPTEEGEAAGVTVGDAVTGLEDGLGLA